MNVTVLSNTADVVPGLEAVLRDLWMRFKDNFVLKSLFTPDLVQPDPICKPEKHARLKLYAQLTYFVA